MGRLSRLKKIRGFVDLAPVRPNDAQWRGRGGGSNRVECPSPIERAAIEDWGFGAPNPNFDVVSHPKPAEGGKQMFD